MRGVATYLLSVLSFSGLCKEFSLCGQVGAGGAGVAGRPTLSLLLLTNDDRRRRRRRLIELTQSSLTSPSFYLKSTQCRNRSDKY